MLRFASLVQRAETLRRPGERTILGITGCPGAGKSTLAQRLVRHLERSAYVPMDGFHLADAALEQLGRRHRKGAIDTFDGNGYAALLRRLHEERRTTVFAPEFDRTLEQPTAAAIVVPPAVEFVVTEGNYLLSDGDSWRAARTALAEVWYCEHDPQVRNRRLLARHIQFGTTEAEAVGWIKAVDTPNARVIEQYRDRADLVINMLQLEAEDVRNVQDGVRATAYSAIHDN